MRAPVLLLAAAAACAPARQLAPDIALAEAGAGNPTVALGPAGAAYATWIETADSSSNVRFAVLTDTSRSTAVRVNDSPGDAAPHDQAPPQLAVAPDGTLYIVWQNNTIIEGRQFPASNLRLARSTDEGRSFEPAIFVNDDAALAPSSHTFQDIAVGPDGTVYVSWIDGRGRSPAEGGFGHAHGAMGGSDVRVARSTDGGRTFSPGVIVQRDVCPCCRTSLAVGAGGMVAVSFRSATDDIRDIMVARSLDGGATFEVPVRVHSDGWRVDACPHAGASLALGPDGALHVAWYTGAEDRQGLWYAHTTPGSTTFGEPQPLVSGGWVPVSQVKLSAAADGRVWLAWDDRRREQPVVRVAVRDGTRLRELDLLLEGRSPAIAAAGNVVVAWQDGERARARLVAER